VAEVVAAFGFLEVVEEFSAALPQGADGAFRGSAEEPLEFGEDQFDGIEVGTVGRQIQELRLGFLDRLPNSGDLVSIQIVEDDDVPGSQGGDQMLLDIMPEDFAIDRPIDDQGSGQATDAQSREKGCRFPVAMRDLGHQAGSFQRPAPSTGHVRFGPGFIEEYKPFRIEAQLRDTP